MSRWRCTGRGVRRQPGRMNKTEARYAAHLETLKQTGEVLWYAFEGVTLKLASDTRYTPDFVVMRAGGDIEFHEVKGFWRDDARIKIKVAAEKFPFRFLAITERAKKLGGGWEREEF